MNSPILNRDFFHPADGWYQIEAKGEHPNSAAGVVQVIDNEAGNAIAQAFNDEAAAGKLRHGSEMLIDHEHFSEQPDKETRAYGWLLELQDREDGIYGRIRWSKTGKEAVDGGDYRFFSTEYEPGDCVECPMSAGPGMQSGELRRRVRPLRLAGLTLTNMNNNRGQKPITNRDANETVNLLSIEQKDMKTVAIQLGLAAEASEEIILAEVMRLLNRVAELIPQKEENKALRNRLSIIDADQVHTLLDLHGVKEEKVRNRLKPVLSALTNREERTAALIDFGFKAEERRGAANQCVRVINRREARQNGPEVMSLNDQALAQRAEAEIGDYKIRNRCTYAEARNAVRTARPELFGLEKK